MPDEKNIGLRADGCDKSAGISDGKNIYRKSVLMLLQLAVLFVLVGVIGVYTPEEFLLRKPSTLCLAALALALMLYFYERIIDKTTRNYLVSVAGMIAFWMLLRGAKYIAFEESESLRQLDNMGVPVNCAPPPAGALPPQTALSAYALFETLLESALPTLQGVSVTFTEGEMKLTLEGAAVTLPAGCSASLTVEDGSSFIKMPLGKEGAPV